MKIFWRCSRHIREITRMISLSDGEQGGSIVRNPINDITTAESEFNNAAILTTLLLASEEKYHIEKPET